MATRKSPASAEKTTTHKAPAKKAVAAKAAAGPVAVESVAVDSAVVDSVTVASNIAKRTPAFEEIAILAEQYWHERGRPFGTPEIDWLRAESALYAA